MLVKRLLHLLVAGVVALTGVALGIGSLVCFFLMIGEANAEFVTWTAVTFLVAAVCLAMGASACMKYATRVLEMADQRAKASTSKS